MCCIDTYDIHILPLQCTCYSVNGSEYKNDIIIKLLQAINPPPPECIHVR